MGYGKAIRLGRVGEGRARRDILAGCAPVEYDGIAIFYQLPRSFLSRTPPLAPMPDLEQLRRNIDAIDDALQEGLRQRAALAREVVRSKGEGGTPLRPDREARILRRLAERHGGDLPLESLFRIWREIISATLQLQTPFQAMVWQGEGEGSALLPLARDFYGGAIPLTSHADARVILEGLATRSNLIAILPFPDGTAGGKWWREYAESEAAASIVGVLPFLQPAAGEESRALIVAQAPFAPSGADTSLFAWRCAGDGSENIDISNSYAEKIDILDKEGEWRLLSVNGYCRGTESSLAPFRESGELRLLGGYANPWEAHP